MVATELAKADAETYGSAMLDSFKIDISHQEMERIIVELELIYRTQPGQWLPIHVRPDLRSRRPAPLPSRRIVRRAPSSLSPPRAPPFRSSTRPTSRSRVYDPRERAPDPGALPVPPAAAPRRSRSARADRAPPLPPQGICNMLAEELGYEDEEEFEDALKGSFKDFIGALPHVEVTNLESELQPGMFRDVFRIIPDPPAEECTPQRLVLKLETRADLWRVLMLHPGAYVEIPELEFEIGADHRRRVDSVYNHIAASIFNLERHVEMLGEDNPSAAAERQGIKDVCEQLRSVLDMDTPATFVVIDPGGLSAFKPGGGREGVRAGGGWAVRQEQPSGCGAGG